MAINRKVLDKYTEAYQDLKRIIAPIEFEPGSECYHQEEWREVLPCYIPGVIPGAYMISTHGRVYSSIKSPAYPNGGIMSHCINMKGYHQINLRSTDGSKICTKIGRLILLHYRFVPGCQYLEVNYIDGNRDHNYIWNLEWVRSNRNNNHDKAYRMKYEQSSNLNERRATELFLDDVRFGEEKYGYLAEKYQVDPVIIPLLVRGTIFPMIRFLYDQDAL